MLIRKINIAEAGHNLPLLMSCVSRGEQVVIEDEHGQTFDLVAHKSPWRPKGQMYKGLFDTKDGYEKKLPDYSW